MTHVICDLDGVIYRGHSALPGAPEALRNLMESVEVVFVTNNSTRPPDAAASKITELTGVPVTAGHVLTSSMAAASLLGPDDGPVLVVGEAGVSEAVASAGLEETRSPLDAGSVVVGLTRHIDYDTIGRAATAVRMGARFVATNIDPTFPTDNGLMPGSGSIVAAISTAAGRRPEVAGKPHMPMRSLIEGLGVTDAWVIGDRVDTDMALAAGNDEWRTIMVLTGVTGEMEARASGVDYVVADFAKAAEVVLTATRSR